MRKSFTEVLRKALLQDSYPFAKYAVQLEDLPHVCPVQTQLFTALIARAIEDLLDGVLILTIRQELLYANDIAHKIMSRLGFYGLSAEGLPQEIWLFRV